MEGRQVIARGFTKHPGEMEVTEFFEKRTNVLELFVMSHCPFAQRAEASIFSRLDQIPVDSRPKVEVRYLFYRRSADGEDTFTALHGESEIAENLAQIVLRDKYPEAFVPYVRMRAGSPHLPFPEVASQAGLAATDIEEVRRIANQERERLIREEYKYAALRYGITDGSPTYVWEGERLTNLKRLHVFKDLAIQGSEACNE